MHFCCWQLHCLITRNMIQDASSLMVEMPTRMRRRSWCMYYKQWLSTKMPNYRGVLKKLMSICNGYLKNNFSFSQGLFLPNLQLISHAEEVHHFVFYYFLASYRLPAYMYSWLDCHSIANLVIEIRFLMGENSLQRYSDVFCSFWSVFSRNGQTRHFKKSKQHVESLCFLQLRNLELGLKGGSMPIDYIHEAPLLMKKKWCSQQNCIMTHTRILNLRSSPGRRWSRHEREDDDDDD